MSYYYEEHIICDNPDCAHKVSGQMQEAGEHCELPDNWITIQRGNKPVQHFCSEECLNTHKKYKDMFRR